MVSRFFIIAGEASGDLHASKLIREIKTIKPSVSFEGIGGPAMAKEGFSSFVNLSKMAVMGFWEVLNNFSFLKKTENKVLTELSKGNFKALILVDYPGFNLRVAKKIKRIKPDLPIFFYISPQIWAWKESRIETIKKHVDKMIVFFPFEEEWYKKRGVKVEFVGHPFVDNLANFKKADCKKRLGLNKNKKYLTLYPGSRLQEINSHLPTMLSALKDDYFKDFEFLLGCAPTIKKDFLNRFDLKGVKIIQDNAIDALACANFAWVGSGTSTLESVFFKTPIVLVYKTSFISWNMIKIMSSVRYAGMPNIILNEELVPELLQNNFTSPNLIKMTKKYFKNEHYRRSLTCGYKKIVNSLGAPGASKRAAEVIIYGS